MKRFVFLLHFGGSNLLPWGLLFPIILTTQRRVGSNLALSPWDLTTSGRLCALVSQAVNEADLGELSLPGLLGSGEHPCLQAEL